MIAAVKFDRRRVLAGVLLAPTLAVVAALLLGLFVESITGGFLTYMMQWQKLAFYKAALQQPASAVVAVTFIAFVITISASVVRLILAAPADGGPWRTLLAALVRVGIAFYALYLVALFLIPLLGLAYSNNYFEIGNHVALCAWWSLFLAIVAAPARWIAVRCLRV